MSKLNLDLVDMDEVDEVLTRLTFWFNFNLLYYTRFSIISRLSLHMVTYSICMGTDTTGADDGDTL